VSILSLKHKTIFIHVTKTAGTAMESMGFLGKGMDKHSNIEHFERLLREIDGLELDDFFKFAFVRNPYTRFASGMMEHVLNGAIDCLESQDRQDQLVRVKEMFTKYVVENKDGDLFSKMVPTRPQHSFVCLRGEVAMDFVGKFENLQEDWKYVAEKLGLKYPLPHILKGRYDDYDYLYTPETRSIVSEVYSEDFERFEYARS